MRGLFVFTTLVLLSSCGTYTNTEVIEYRQVTVTPAYEVITVVSEEPVDVTQTTLEYY